MRYENPKDHSTGRSLLSGLGWMATGGLAVGALMMGNGVWQAGDRIFATLNQMLHPVAPAPRVDVQSVVIQQIRDVSELATATFTMQAVVPTSQDATVSGFVIGTTKLLYIAYGEVKAGVDLSHLTPASVQVTGDSIQIQLPPPQILDSKIDVNRSSVYDYNRGMLGLGPDVAPELQSLAQQEALKKIEAAACTDNVLGKASDRAKLVVTQLLSTTGYRNVSVSIPAVPPESCIPPRSTTGNTPDLAPR